VKPFEQSLFCEHEVGEAAAGRAAASADSADSAKSVAREPRKKKG
jgi:hypothetical protein